MGEKTVLNFRVQRKTLNNACRAELGCFPPIITLAALKEASQPVCVCVRTHLEAVQLEPPAVSNGDLP